MRRAYRLTIDRRETDALDGIPTGCSSTEMLTYARRMLADGIDGALD